MQLLVIKYKSHIKLAKLRSTQNPMCNAEECHTLNIWYSELTNFELMRFPCTPELLHYAFIS